MKRRTVRRYNRIPSSAAAAERGTPRTLCAISVQIMFNPTQADLPSSRSVPSPLKMFSNQVVNGEPGRLLPQGSDLPPLRVPRECLGWKNGTYRSIHRVSVQTAGAQTAYRA